jgi:hypothetical protein
VTFIIFFKFSKYIQITLANAGSKLGLMFETIEGGFLDIDVRIVGPDGKVLYQVNYKFHL